MGKINLLKVADEKFILFLNLSRVSYFFQEIGTLFKPYLKPPQVDRWRTL